MIQEKPSVGEVTDQGQCQGIWNQEQGKEANLSYPTMVDFTIDAANSQPGMDTDTNSTEQPVSETDPLQALYDAGYTSEGIQALLGNLPTNLTHDELKVAVDGILARGDKLTPDPPGFEHIVCASDVEYTDPAWTIRPYIQRGALTLCQGAPGIGKTAFLCGLSACISTGTPLTDAGGFDRIPIDDPGNVLMLSVEDDFSVLKGRFSANGGNIDNLFFLDDAFNISLAVSADLERLENTIKELNAKLVILDPLQAFLTNVNFHMANETRPCMAKLAEIAKRCDCAVVIIAHTSKGSRENTPVMRSLGSIDVPASCRSVLHVEKLDPESGEIGVFHVKSNTAKAGRTIVYTIGDHGSVQWERFTDDTLYQVEQTTREKPQRDTCKEFVLQVLEESENGLIKSTDLDQLITEQDISKATADRAKSELKRDGKIRYIPMTEDGKRVYYTALVNREPSTDT